jgi:hypothetical protein
MCVFSRESLAVSGESDRKKERRGNFCYPSSSLSSFFALPFKRTKGPSSSFLGGPKKKTDSENETSREPTVLSHRLRFNFCSRRRRQQVIRSALKDAFEIEHFCCGGRILMGHYGCEIQSLLGWEEGEGSRQWHR